MPDTLDPPPAVTDPPVVPVITTPPEPPRTKTTILVMAAFQSETTALPSPEEVALAIQDAFAVRYPGLFWFGMMGRPGQGLKHYRAKGTVNFRDGPSTTEKVRGQLHDGEIISELTEYGDWIGHERGYSHKKYLELIPE